MEVVYNIKLTPRIIWDAFGSTINDYFMNKNIPLKEYKNGKRGCFFFVCDGVNTDQKNSSKEMLKLWYLNYDGIKLGQNKNVASEFVPGNRHTVSPSEIRETIKERGVVFFYGYMDYLSKMLDYQIKCLICLECYDIKSKTNFLSKLNDENIDKYVRDDSCFPNYKALSNEFSPMIVKRIVEAIKDKGGAIQDELIKDTKFKDIINDNERNSLERLTLLLIMSVFCAASHFEGEKEYLDELYDVFYDNQGQLRPKEDDIVNKEVIWSAGKSWYESTREKGKRFAGFSPIHSILPMVIDSENESSTDSSKLGFSSLLSENNHHLYMYGVGGIGKTTSLYSIMDNAYSIERKQNEPVPLFIELSMASSGGVVGGECHFIRNTVYDLIEQDVKKRRSDVKIPRNELEKLVDEVLCVNNLVPEYVFLLDGLNEISRELVNSNDEFSPTILDMVKAEIRLILNKYRNVRVIITGRNMDRVIGERVDVDVFRLTEIDEDNVKKYLKNNGVRGERLKQTIDNKKLMGILRTPLFLTMYVKLRGEDVLLSRGEILNAFYTRRKEDFYSERGRKIRIADNLAEEQARPANATDEMHSYMLDFIMSEIAWWMVKHNRKYISDHELLLIIKDSLGGDSFQKGDLSKDKWCGCYGKECYKQYGYNDPNNTYKIAKRIFIKYKGPEDWDDVRYYICEYLRDQLGLLVEVEKNRRVQYAVVHQEIRDYFAALYHINLLRLAVYIKEGQNDLEMACDCLSEWEDNPLPSQVLTFIGEALGELHNAPSYNDDTNEWENNILDPNEYSFSNRTLLRRALDIFRDKEGRFNNRNGYAVWNLLQILKLVREDLSGEDFSYLDLTRCRLNGYRLANKSFKAVFNGSKINDSVFIPSGHSNRVNYAQFSSDGRYIVTASDDGTAVVWDTRTNEEVVKLQGHEGKVNYAAFSPDGKYIVTASDDNTAMVWKYNERKNTYEFYSKLSGHHKEVNYASFSSDGALLVTASNDNSAIVWKKRSDTNDFYIIDTLMHSECINSVEFFGNYVLSSSDDYTAVVWEWNSTDSKYYELSVLKHDKPVRIARFNPDGSCIVTASECSVILWKKNSKNGKYERYGNEFSHSGFVFSAAFSNSGNCVITASKDRTVRIWDLDTHQLINEFTDKDHPFRSAVFSKDDKFILTTTWRETKVWDTDSYSEVPGGVFRSSFSAVFSANCDSEEKQIVIGCREGTAKVFRLSDYKEETEGLLKGHNHSVYSAEFSPHGNYIVTASGDGTARIYNSKTFRELPNGVLEGHKDRVHTAYFSNDEEYIVTASRDHTCKIWKRLEKDGVSSYEEVDGSSIRHTASVNMAKYSPDGKFIITASEDGTVMIWDAIKYEQIGKPIVIGPIVETADFIPTNMKWILTADYEGNLHLWDTETHDEVKNGKMIKCMSTNRSYASFSPDGSKFVVASWDGYAQVYEYNSKSRAYVPAKNGKLEGHAARVSTAVFSRRKYILTASADNTVKIWDAETYACCATIDSRSGLEVWGVDLTHVSKKSNIQDETLRILEEYGAIVRK